MPPSPLCLVGEVIVDVFLDPAGSPHIRLGGVLHAARALSALRSASAIGAVLPAYLTQEARQATAAYGATAFQIVGQVTGAPNVLLIPEPTEAGNQRYELLMRNTAVTDLDLRVLDTLLAEQEPSDVLVFPGSYDLAGVLQILGRRACRVHVDAAYGVDDPAPLKALGRPLDTFIISTSSRLFTDRYAGTPSRLVADIVPAHARALLLKENRGGSRLFSSSGTISCPAQMSSTRHSVGVGDCFDAVFVATLPDVGDRAALQYAACLAAEYAATFDLDKFKRAASAYLSIPADEIGDLSGTSVPWERRPSIQIYLAAPDFSEGDTTAIEASVAALRYHNFAVRRPVKEHGELPHDAPEAERARVADADVGLLQECALVVAVLPYDDPGTLIEIGLAVAARQPVIVYDPYDRIRNPMLTELVFARASRLADVVAAVFRAASGILAR